MSREAIRILIVDENSADRELFKQLLLQDTQREYVVFEADCGTGGRDLFWQEKPHCILLEYRLPDVDGLGLLPQFTNGSAPGRMAAIVMVTGRGNENVAVQALKGGAHDYLAKDSLTAEVLHASIEKALASVEQQRRRTRKANKLRHDVETMQVELNVAGDIQRWLLPSASPRLPGFDIAGHCVPAEETGGDFFDYIVLRDGTLGVVLGDVSGHGLGPAILAAETRAHLRAFAQTCADPGLILARANRLLCQDTRGRLFVTLFLACLDPKNRLVRFSSAGHRGYLLTASGAVSELEVDQPPLGLALHFVVPIQQERSVASGDLLLLATDGLLDACRLLLPRQADEPPDAGTERLLQIVQANRHLPAAGIVQALFGTVLESSRAHHRPRAKADDMTAVVVKAL